MVSWSLLRIAAETAMKLEQNITEIPWVSSLWRRARSPAGVVFAALMAVTYASVATAGIYVLIRERPLSALEWFAEVLFLTLALRYLYLGIAAAANPPMRLERFIAAGVRPEAIGLWALTALSIFGATITLWGTPFFAWTLR